MYTCYGAYPVSDSLLLRLLPENGKQAGKIRWQVTGEHHVLPGTGVYQPQFSGVEHLPVQKGAKGAAEAGAVPPIQRIP